MFKKFLHGSASSLLLIALLSGIGFTVFSLVVQPAHLKQWVSSSGIYKTLPGILLDHADQEQETNDLGVSLKNTEVQKAAKQAFSPQFIQNSTEQFIDGTFNWLDGTVAKPDFSINIGAAKAVFANNIAAYAVQRYQSLPACAPNTPPTSDDPLTIDCQVPIGFDINQEAELLKTQITSSKEFLPQSVLTADTLQQDNPQDSVFTKTAIPKAYKRLQTLPLILGGLALVLAVVIILSAATKAAGIKRVGVVLVAAGLLAGFAIWAGSIAVGTLADRLAVNSSSDTAVIIKNMISSAGYAMQRDILQTGLYVAGSVGLVGLLLLGGVSLKTRKKMPKISAPSPHDPKPSKPAAKVKIPQKAKPAASPKPKPVPMIKPKNQPKPTIIKPSGPIGSSDKLIQ
jgi:hypothetical protein